MFNFKWHSKINTPTSELSNATGPLAVYEEELLQSIKAVILSHTEKIQDRQARYVEDYNAHHDVEILSEFIGSNAVDMLKSVTDIQLPRITEQKKGLKAKIFLGGSTLLVSLINSVKGGEVSVEEDHVDLKQVLDCSKVTASTLFTLIGETIKVALDRANVPKDYVVPILFTTSHPLEGNCITHLRSYLKEDFSQADPVAGTNVKELMNFCCKKLGFKAKCVLVQSVSLTSLAGSPSLGLKPDAFAAISLGSGLDVSYLDVDHSAVSHLLNLDLNECKQAVFRSIVDQCHDFSHGSKRGFRSIERMVGGDGLAESVRLSFCKIWQGETPSRAFDRLVFCSDDIFGIVNDKTETGIVAQNFISKALNTTPTPEMVYSFRELSQAAVTRAASIITGIIIGLAKYSGRCVEGYGTATVILQGMVFEKNTSFVTAIQKQVTASYVGGPINVKYYRNAPSIGASMLLESIGY